MTAGQLVVRTVLGPVAPGELGITSCHEHLWMDSTSLLAVHGYAAAAPSPWDATVAAEARWNPGVHPDNYRLTDVDTTVAELARFTAAGGRTIVELTPPTLGRDVRQVASIARAAGVQVVLGTGQYLAPTHASWVAERTDDELVEHWVGEATDGLDGTPIRPGIFGEIGTSDPVTPAEVRVLRAIGAASVATGLAVSVHVHPWGHEGQVVLGHLIDAGADPTRVILGHLSTAIDRPDELRRLTDRGAILGFDLFGFDHSLLGPGRWPPSDRDVAQAIAALVRDGHGDRIVLGQDIGVRTRLRRWGGWGYGHLLEHVRPLLGELGVDDGAVRAMLVTTPARVLSVPA